MRSKNIVSTLTLVLLLQQWCDASSSSVNGFGVGHRLPDDEELFTIVEKARGSPDYVLNYAKTYATSEVEDEHLIVTRLVVEDLANAGAHAAVIAGGPGHTFVSLGYAIPRYGEMSFRATIYGKRPAFRKIP